MKKAIQFILASVLLVSLLALSGCNTARGLGQDIESLGERMQRSSN